ncbi:MAG: hypothetical protein K1X78_03250 [Verrucomicrobiaceae bacterium]|nr:hypothetical protein [Verrucomicrobiaceae bacterium]
MRLLLLSLLATTPIFAQTRWIEAQPKGSTEWKARETRTLDSLPQLNTGPIPETKYGGRADHLQKATGFFRVEKLDDRWWLIDPDGGPFVFTGVASVKPRSDFAAKEPFAKLFGSTDAWRTKTLDQFRALGFRGCGGFSDHETLRAATKPMPYTVTLSLMSSFGKKLGLTHQQPGHTGYEEDCLPVFHPDFAAHCAQVCKDKLSAMKDDPFLVGTFSDNELPIPADMLDRMLKLDATKKRFKAMRDGATVWLAKRGIERAKITDADRRAFVEHVFSMYFETTTKAIRTVLPHHLCLGSRFHDPAVNKQGVWRAAGKWCDVISLNYYYVWTPQPDIVRRWTEWSGKPCMITEFYAKGTDSGMANTTGAGWLVHTQAERGAFYQNFALALMESKTCVGWHWFKYMDNDPADPKTDPSNKDSNKGMFSATYEPYQPLLDAMRELNTRVYSIIDDFN